ncbi:exosortase A [soil metagenome]
MTVAIRPEQFAPAAPRFGARWRVHAAMLSGVAAVLLLLFRRDAGDLATIWWTSTTFGHCLFVGPVIAWLVWQRREQLAQVTPQAWWPGLALVAAGGFGWLLGEAASVSLARQLGLLLMLQGAVVSVLGPNVARALLFPLCYALFLVPFGEELEAPLQAVTVGITMPLLHLFGVPAMVDGVLITIPNGYFEVAEACSGAKFVIAMLAYGVLVANVCFVSWQRRAGFMAMALIVPVIANGLRAFGTIYAAHLTSVAAATGFDHIVYGWVFFGAVMAAVLAIGWKWFDRDPDAAWVDVSQFQAVPRFAADYRAAAIGAVGVAIAFLGWGVAIDGRADALPAHPALPEVAGWSRAAPSKRAPWTPHYPGADKILFQRYADARGVTVDLAVAIYGGQHEGKEMIAFGQGALRENDRWVKIEDLEPLEDGAVLRMTAPNPVTNRAVERQVVRWYRVGDVLTASGGKAKLATTKVKLLGGPQRAVAVLLSAEAGQAREPRQAMQLFLDALGPVDALADRLSGIR